MDRRRFLLASLPAVAVGLAGCSGDSGTPEPTPEPTPESTPEPTPESTPEPTPTATPTATATSESTPTPEPTATPEPTPAPEGDLTVTVGPGGSLVFDPESFEISTGDTVRWEHDSPGHNVSPASQPEGAEWPGDDGTTHPSGHTHTYTFTAAGEYEYHCDPHQSIGMVGSFTVR